jgi:hypothetical protein
MGVRSVRFTAFSFALPLSLVVSACAVETADQDIPEETEESGTSQALLAGRRLREGEIAALVRSAGFPESMVGKMVCTAKYESSYYERASNRNRGGSIDRGLFQINSVHLGTMRGCPRSGEALFDAETNAKCAYAIYRAQGIRAWYGYRAHRSECDRFRAPASIDEPDNSGGEGCYSPTLHSRVDEAACVQGRSNGVWYQCHEGAWARGVDEAAKKGQFGDCASFHPLE